MAAHDLASDFPDLTAHDVGAILGLSYHAVLRAAHAGEVPFYKIRGRIRFRRSDVLGWIDRCRIETEQESSPKKAPAPKLDGPAPETGSLESLRALERKYFEGA